MRKGRISGYILLPETAHQGHESIRLNFLRRRQLTSSWPRSTSPPILSRILFFFFFSPRHSLGKRTLKSSLFACALLDVMAAAGAKTQCNLIIHREWIIALQRLGWHNGLSSTRSVFIALIGHIFYTIDMQSTRRWYFATLEMFTFCARRFVTLILKNDIIL